MWEPANEMCIEIPNDRAAHVMADLMLRKIVYRSEYLHRSVKIYIHRELESVMTMLDIVMTYFVDGF